MSPEKILLIILISFLIFILWFLPLIVMSNGYFINEGGWVAYYLMIGILSLIWGIFVGNELQKIK